MVVVGYSDASRFPDFNVHKLSDEVGQSPNYTRRMELYEEYFNSKVFFTMSFMRRSLEMNRRANV